MITNKGCIVQNVKQGYILQQVNCMSVMNSGVAKAIRQEYPGVYYEYKDLCNQYQNSPELLGCIQTVNVSRDLAIINLFSQYKFGPSWQHHTNYDALRKTLAWFDKAKDKSKQIHHPMIGAGLGGGDWTIISKMIEDILGTETNLWVLE